MLLPGKANVRAISSIAVETKKGGEGGGGEKDYPKISLGTGTRRRQSRVVIKEILNLHHHAEGRGARGVTKPLAKKHFLFVRMVWGGRKSQAKSGMDRMDC